MSITASEFLKWCEVFKVQFGGGAVVNYPITMPLGGTGANLTPTNNAIFYSTASHGALLPTADTSVLITDNVGNLVWSTTLPSGTMALAPTSSTSIVNKAYVDAAVAGLQASVVYLASTTNLTGYTYNNGVAGVGATLIAPSPGAFTMDGVTAVVNVNILYKDDTDGSGAYNGIYTVTTLGDVATPAVLTRATTYDTPTKIAATGLIAVVEGTVNEGTGWLEVLTVTTIGVDPLMYIQFGQPSGIVPLARGGTNNDLTSLAGAIMYSTAEGMQLTAVGNVGQLLFSTSDLAPVWTSATYPFSTTINRILYSTSNDVIGELNTANNAVLVTSAGGVPSLSTTLPAGLTIPGYQPSITPAALTSVSDTNITLALGGTPATALLQGVSITAGWFGELSLARGGTNADLSATAGAIVYSTSSAFALTGAGLSGQLLSSAGSGEPVWTTATYPLTTTINQVLYSSADNVIGGISTVDNAVMISSAGGVPSFSTTLPSGLTIPGYSPTITPAALTVGSDTNITLTLGGSPSVALLAAASVTAGWNGELSLARGGTNANLTASNGGILYSTATAMAILAGTATAGQMLQSGATAAPVWSTSTYPATNAINTLLYASAANVISALATADNGVLVTGVTGVPSISTTLPSGLTIPGYAKSGANADITSMSGLTGGIGAPTAILDTNGNAVVTFAAGITSAVNAYTFTNAATGNAPTIVASGTDSNINWDTSSKGTGIYIARSANTSTPIQWKTGTTLQHTTNWIPANTAQTRNVTLQDLDGTMAYLSNINAVFIATATASNSASLAFTNLTGYSNYMIQFNDLLPVTNAAQLALQYSLDNGVTWRATSGDYLFQVLAMSNSTLTGVASATTGYHPLGNSSVNTAGGGPSGFVMLQGLNGLIRTGVQSSCAFTGSVGPTQSGYITQGVFTSSSNITAVRLVMTSGNIASGTAQIYGFS